MAGIITQLRDQVPLHPLKLAEAMRVAELQAIKLLRLTNIEGPPVPDTVITELPRLQVERVSLGDTSGAAQWAHGRWLILLNRRDVQGRQRFSLCHEFKHILDHPFINVLYLDDGHGLSRQERQEQVCDHFAGCLLMPRKWVRQVWAEGTRDSRALAVRFAVSYQAMNVRLNQLGLATSRERYAK